MLKPLLISNPAAERLGIAAGLWWGVDDDGYPVLGPYATREAALVGITAHGTGETPERLPPG